ncbi:hypothetical protein DA093_24560 [Vibrio rotiferianus]|uniref:hypothetical protein n=1 Tax=Vibrio rotiferianus TaxID=190895 RepID=UPI0003A11A16|nr:hypothetical protein [Vibrio rotiferianus]PIB13132.1 hypothetical protein B853_20079 [Vibrio rotiferianus CAIM 577 = LMG 21460]TMX31112.1 hypothetical protein DA095_23785 [Vibrio rotiferianus]TMX43287.1 hypothetical protein DA093_24560 [Vibrio rotiferianus]
MISTPRSLHKLLLLLFIIGFTFPVSAYNAGNYPRLAYIKVPHSQQTYNQSNHPLTTAVEQSSAISINDRIAIASDWNLIMPQQAFEEGYIYRRLSASSLIHTLTPLISEFTCAEYRFRHRQQEASDCTKATSRKKGKIEGMPFVSGQYTMKSAINDYDDQRNRISYEAKLPASSEHSLDTIDGSVHELGTFFGRLASSDSLVLSIRLNVYTLDSNQLRDKKLNISPIVLFVVLPSAREISQQPNQIKASMFAVQQAKLLIIGRPQRF